MGRNRVEAVVVGAGLMGRWHAHAIRRTGGAVVGVVDSDPERAAGLVGYDRGCRVFTDLELALATLAPDIVHVCTPLDTHAALVRMALQAKCHVFAEKPLAPTADETRDLLAAAEAAGRLLVPVHQFPFQDGALVLIDRLPEIGPVVHIDVSTASAGATVSPGAGADAIAAEILPHFLSLTRRLLGVRLADQQWSVTRFREGEWQVVGLIGDAASVTFLVSMAARPTFAELRLLGEHGSARLDLFHGFAVFESEAVSRSAKVRRPFGLAGRSMAAATANLARRVMAREPAYPGLTELVRRFYLAVGGLRPSPILPEETLDIARTRDLLVALRAEGNTI
jgi:predicted dehydrogenase